MSKKAAEKITALVQEKGKDGKTLNLSKNPVNADAKEIANAIQYIKDLVSLDLEKNELEDDGLSMILEAIAKHAKGLRALNIAQNRLQRLDSILGVFQNCINLSTFDASANTLWIGGIEPLSDAINKFGKSLVKLRLSNNNLRSVDAKLIANALQGCPQLDSLELGTNRIGDDGVRYLMEGIVQNGRSLNQIQLNNNGITTLGAKFLAAAIPAQFTLSSVLLDGNPLGDAGVEALSAILVDCPSISVLSLNDVGMTDEGAKKLLEAVNNCPSLIWLPVDKNGLSDDLVQQLAAAVKKNEEPGRKQQAAAKRKQALQSAMAAQDAREKAKRALKEVADNAAKA